jgi:hypothetical protein
MSRGLGSISMDGGLNSVACAQSGCESSLSLPMISLTMACSHEEMKRGVGGISWMPSLVSFDCNLEKMSFIFWFSGCSSTSK